MENKKTFIGAGSLVQIGRHKGNLCCRGSLKMDPNRTSQIGMSVLAMVQDWHAKLSLPPRLSGVDPDGFAEHRMNAGVLCMLPEH